MLWEPLAVAALNQPIDQAAAASFAAVLRRDVRAQPARRRARAAARAARRDVCRSRRARIIEQRGGSCSACRAPSRFAAATCSIRNERLDGAGRHLRGPVARAVGLCCPSVPPRSAASSTPRIATDASPIVTVNLWFDRVVTDRALVGLPGRTLQWVFDKRAVFGEQASHLSLISSGAEARGRAQQPGADRPGDGEVSAALPAARSASLLRAVVVREKKASFSVAPGQPPRPAHQNRRARIAPRRRLDRHRPARYHRGRRHQRPLGRATRHSSRLASSSMHVSNGSSIPQ